MLSEPGALATALVRAQGGAWLPQEPQSRRDTLRRGQVQLQQQLERLTDAYLRAVIPISEYERRRRDLEQRLAALAGQEEQLRNDAERQRQLAGLAASLEVFRARVQRGLDGASFEQRRQLVLLLVDRVVVTDADVEIRYVLPTSPESEHVRFCHLRKDYFDDPAMSAEALGAVDAGPCDARDDAALAQDLPHRATTIGLVCEQLVRPAAGPSAPPAADRQHGDEGSLGPPAIVPVGGAERQA
jgi:site-specific DNA recombinase